MFVSQGYLLGTPFLYFFHCNLFLCQPDQEKFFFSVNAMMAKTQILNDIKPDIFLGKRKVFGILFLFIIHIFSAKVSSPHYSNLGEGEVAVVVSDSAGSDQIDGSDHSQAIYVTSGTTVVDFDNEIEGKIITLDSPASKVESKTIAKKSTREKAVKQINTNRSVKKEPSEEIVYCYPSSKNDFYYSISESHMKALVPSHDSEKVFLKACSVPGKLILKDLFQNTRYYFYNQIFISDYCGLFSGRAPPFFS